MAILGPPKNFFDTGQLVCSLFFSLGLNSEIWGFKWKETFLSLFSNISVKFITMLGSAAIVCILSKPLVVMQKWQVAKKRYISFSLSSLYVKYQRTTSKIMFCLHYNALSPKFCHITALFIKFWNLEKQPLYDLLSIMWPKQSHFLLVRES